MPIPVPGRVAEQLRRSTVAVIGRQSHGTAIVLADGRVLTNAHVIGPGPLSVELWEGKRVQATVVKTDRRRDLALLSTPSLDASPATLADSDRLRAGTPVLAVGNPFGFQGAVSSGVVHLIGPAPPVSSLRWIHADIHLAPGNSGGPLANFAGEVLGVNTMILANGIALAVPSRAVQRFLTSASSEMEMGVTVRPVTLRDGEFGLMVLELAAGGAAERASLLPGDVLIGANGERFHSVDDFQASLQQPPGFVLRIGFYRAGILAKREVSVQLEPKRMRNAA